MKSIITACIFLALFILFGCSGGGNAPVTPDSMMNMNLTDGNLKVGVSEYFSDATPAGGTGVLGLYNLVIDTEQLKAEITPLRETALTDVLEVVDITGFLRVAPCTDCVHLQSIELDIDSNIVLSIGIKHPFAPGNPTLPISGKNRADLHVFNIEGTVVSDGGGTPTTFTGIGETVGAFTLFNADGYSPYLDASLETILTTSATVHPYKLHFDDYGTGNFNAANPTGFQSVTDPGPSGNLVMKMGSDYNYQDYIFSDLGTGSFEFIYAIGCTYAVSAANKAQRFSPEYRVPQHNKKAASEVKVEIVSNDLMSGDTGSTCDLEIQVHDINHGIAVGTGLNQMLADSSVEQISIEVKGVTSSPVVLSSPTPTGGDGRTAPLLFDATVTNTSGATEGFYTGLVKVLDSYNPGQNTAPLLNGMDGIKRVGPTDNPLDGLFDIAEFATYQTFEVEVIVAAPICVIETTPDPPTALQGETVVLDGSSSSCAVPITTYEWDLDYDGVTFADPPDATGVSVNYVECVAGLRTIALKVTNANMLFSICTVDVTINSDTGPIDGWGTDVNIMPLNVFTLNTSFRGMRAYGSDIYSVANTTSSPYNIYFVRSEDYGQTWQTPVQVTTYSAGTTQYANLWVDGNNGDIYCSYVSTAGIYSTYDTYLTRSQDRGDTWGTPIQVNNDTAHTTTETYCNVSIDDSVDPARVYFIYQTSTYDVWVARTTSNNLTSWSYIQIDDSTLASNQPIIYVNPVDYSVNAIWTDPINYSGGTGRVLFDRSTDNGVTWGTDVTIYQHTGTYGPYEPSIAVNPTTGIPGVEWRDITAADRTHRFSKATSAAGTAWSAPVTIGLVPYSGYASWAGSLDVSPDGHWVIAFKHTVGVTYQTMFNQSQDDGVTWGTAVRIDDSGSIWNPNLCMDECKNVHVSWADRRSGTAYAMYYDRGS